MANLIKFKNEYNEELGITPLQAHKMFGKGITKKSFKRVGTHFFCKVTGCFLKDIDSTWDEVSIIR